MKILTVNVHYAPESYGGATIVAEEVTRELADRGHQMYVLTGSTDPALPTAGLHRYQDGDIPVLAMGRSLPRTPAEEYLQPHLGQRFAQVLASIRPDVVHFHAIQALGVEMVERAVETVPTVVTLHDAWWLCERQFMVRSTGRWCGQVGIDPRVCATCVPDPAEHEKRQDHSRRILNSCSAVLAPSAYWAKVMGDSGVDARVLQVNRNGVMHPAADFERTPYTGPVRFGYVGGDNRIKGAPQLRAALEGMTRSDYRLRVVDSSLKLGARSIHPQDWQYSGHIEIVPGYDYANIDDFFDSIDVLIFPSQWRESYGLTVREAVLRGVWVIATEGGGTTEDLAEAVNASLIPLDGRADALRAAMEAVLDDPARYAGRARAIKPIPTFSDQAEHLETVYGKCLHEQRDSPVK
jgi:glycosyltransferase involved in cell wall biosynthesis